MSEMILVNHHLPTICSSQIICLSHQLETYRKEWEECHCKIYSLSNLIWISTWENLIPALTCPRSSSFLRKDLPCVPAGMEHWFCTERTFYKGIWNSVVICRSCCTNSRLWLQLHLRIWDLRYDVWLWTIAFNAADIQNNMLSFLSGHEFDTILEESNPCKLLMECDNMDTASQCNQKPCLPGIQNQQKSLHPHCVPIHLL